MRDVVRNPRLGMSYRPPLHDFFTTHEPSPGFCEIDAGAAASMPEIADLALDMSKAGIEVQVHATQLSLFATENQDTHRDIDAVGALADKIGARFVSAHLASGEMMVGPIRSFCRPAYTERVCDDAMCRMGTLARRLGCSVTAENIAYYGGPIYDEMSEIDFLNRIAVGLPRSVLFDISNFFTNATNKIGQPGNISELKIDNIVYLHISGGRWLDNVYVDSHGDAIPQAHLDQLKDLRSRCSDLKVLYERDIRYENRAQVSHDLRQIARIIGDASPQDV